MSASRARTPLEVRAAFRERLAGAELLVGTFLKVPTIDTVALAAAAGYDLVVVDLEHSALSEQTATAMVRHASLLGLPALVRVAKLDAGLVNRLLEGGACGIQLSSVRSCAQVAALVQATRFAPEGDRSVSLAHPAAGFSGTSLSEFLASERQHPPVLVGQFETATWQDPIADLMAGLDVAVVGTTDLAVSLGEVSAAAPRVRASTEQVAHAAGSSGTIFGGWVPALAQRESLGLGDARYLLVGSDLQLLAAAMRSARSSDESPADHKTQEQAMATGGAH